MDKFILRIHACSSVVFDKKEFLCNSCENGVFISMFKLVECICCKEIGITQAELETGGTLCITESPRFIAMFCIFPCVNICSMSDHWMIPKPPHKIVISLLILSTKHYGI